jgi:1,4-dihydroxy-2-naphthoyl-CoA hydrolase
MTQPSASTPRTVEEIQQLLDASPMIRFLQIHAQLWNPEEARLVCSMPHRPELANEPGAPAFHGGAIGALMDTVASYLLTAQRCSGGATVDLRTDYLRVAAVGELRCTAIARHIGDTHAVVDAEVHDAIGKLIAVGRCTLALLPAKA